MNADIPGCVQVVAVARHREGLVAEGGEGREAPEYTDEDKGAELGREQLAGVGEACKRPNQETAQEINGERSIGEGGQREMSVHGSAQAYRMTAPANPPEPTRSAFSRDALNLTSTDSGRPTVSRLGVCLLDRVPDQRYVAVNDVCKLSVRERQKESRHCTQVDREQRSHGGCLSQSKDQ